MDFEKKVQKMFYLVACDISMLCNLGSDLNCTSKIWVLHHKKYGLWSIRDVWVMDWVSPHTKLVI
jgi:hypothetical protein